MTFFWNVFWPVLAASLIVHVLGWMWHQAIYLLRAIGMRGPKRRGK